MAGFVTGKKKYIIIALLFLGWCLGNIDRLSMNYAVISITKDLNLSASATGAVLSSFFAGYALMQIPGGFLADKFGSKKVILAIITVWSIFTIFTGLAWSLVSMIVIRVVFGLAEGSFFPSGSKLIAESFPKKERGRVMSIMLSSGAIAGIFLPVIATSMMGSVGWRKMFFLIGAIGIAVAILYKFFLPRQTDTTKDVHVQSSDDKKSGSLIELLKQPMIWCVFIAYFGAYTINWGTASWLPSYLVSVRHLDLKTLGWVSMLPYVAALIGMFGSGFVFDKLPKGLDKKLAAIGMVCVSVLLFLMFTTGSLTAYIIYSIFLMLFMSFVGVVLPSIPLKYLPTEVVGKASGFINTGGQLAGFLTPLVIGFIVDASKGSFNAAFMYMVAFGIISAISLSILRYNNLPKLAAESIS
jgi:MFS transporter, ACS family, glucarate transporter